MFRFKKISSRLSFYIISYISLLFICIFFVNHYISKSLIFKNVNESIKNLTEGTVNKIYSDLITIEKIPENIAYIIENSDPSEENLHGLLKSLIQSNPNVYGSCIAFESNIYYKDKEFYAPYYYKSENGIGYKDLGENNYKYLKWDWYNIPKKLLCPVWSEPYFDEGGGDIVMATYSVPFFKIYNGKRTFCGIATIDISLTWLNDTVSSLKIFKNGYGFIVSKTGTFVSHPRKSFIMKENILRFAKLSGDIDIIKIIERMLSGRNGFYSLKKTVAEKKSWIYFAPLASTGWSLGIIFPENDIFTDLYDLNKKLIFIGLAGFIMLFLVIILISSKISNPVEELAKSAIRIGTGDFNTDLPKIKSNDEIAILCNSFISMQKALKEYMENLKKTTSIKEKIESELQIAHDIQMGIIPKSFPAFPERDEFDIYAVLEPAKAVGGDLYDFFFLDKDHLCFAIGDVSGKGIPASLMMAVARTLLRAKTSHDHSIEDIVSTMNNEFCENNESSMFLTFIMGLMNINTGDIIYCNAGHNPPFILRSEGKIEKLEDRHGIPLGIFKNQSYSSGKIKLNLHDKLFLYTDGVTEANDIGGKLIGEDEISGLLALIYKESPKRIILSILEAINEYSKGADQFDDITMLTIERLKK